MQTSSLRPMFSGGVAQPPVARAGWRDALVKKLVDGGIPREAIRYLSDTQVGLNTIQHRERAKKILADPGNPGKTMINGREIKVIHITGTITAD